MPQKRQPQTQLIILCAECCRIKDEQGNWFDADQHNLDQHRGKISHGLCPHCVHKLYPHLLIKTGGRGRKDTI